MMHIHKDEDYVAIYSRDDKYILTEWNVKRRRAMGYIVRAALEIYNTNPASVLIIGLGGGAIMGELARLKLQTNVSFTCVEFDEKMVQHYNRMMSLYYENIESTIINCNFINFRCENTFDVIFGDIPYFYEDTTCEEKNMILEIMLRASHIGTVWILNMLAETNMQKWISFMKKKEFNISRPYPCRHENHFLLKLRVKTETIVSGLNS